MIKQFSKGWSSKWRLVPLFAVGLFALTACTQGISKEEAATKDRQIQDLQAQLVSVQQDSTY